MTQLFLFFIILSAPLSFAGIVETLKLQGFSCTKQNLTACSYHECTGKLGSYPKTVLITVPQNVDSLRLHFHGHILNQPNTRPYEGSLSGMIAAFGLQKSLCESSEVTIFPQSSGANTTYKEFFKDRNSYTQFFGDIQHTLNNQLKDSPFHLSGHSGGGKYVAAALNAVIKTARVSIFDGIYSDATKDSLKTWYQTEKGKLTIATVKGMSPDSFANQIRSELEAKFVSSKSNINGTKYDVHRHGNFLHYSRSYSESAHFDTVSEVWPIKD